MKKVAIIFWEDYLSIAPTIISLAKGFSEKQINVDIFTKSLNKRYPEIKFKEANINVITLMSASNRNNSMELFLNNALKRFENKYNIAFNIYNFFKLGFKFINELKSFIDRSNFKKVISKQFKDHQYDMYIVTDSTGIALLPDFVFEDNIKKLFFLSLELEERSVFNLLLDPYKVFCYNLQAKLLPIFPNIIIQDNSRAGVLIREFNLEKGLQNFYLLPNSISRPKSYISSSLLENRFSIKNNIVLHIGQISETALALEIAKSLNDQIDYSLVFHDKKFTDINDPYIQLILNSVNYPVHFSLRPVELDELDEIILSADIGILAYSSNFGKNFELITNASGKLIMLLRLGIPVIVKEFPGVRDLIEKYNCGVVVSEWDQVIPAANKIMENLCFYKENAIKCFNSEFDFNRYFDLFFEEITIDNEKK